MWAWALVLESYTFKSRLTSMTLPILFDHYDCFSIYKTRVIIYVAVLWELDEWYNVCKVPTILTGQSMVEAK